MKTIKKVVEVPQLSIHKEYIEDTLRSFITNNLGVNCSIYVDDTKSIYNTEEAKQSTTGNKGYVFNVRIGYGGDVYFEDKGYPIAWGQGYTSGRIRIYKEKGETRTREEMLEDVYQYVEYYNNGIEYGFQLLDEKGDEVDSCFGFYELEAIKQNLPKEWEDEDLSKYIIEN
jgi:hypothetical protein